ncbi:unnamed protein product [Fusarium graminearum]|uniref:Chromosome 2, complete genome n=1 Tax=Gibberella zeae (strain ATCC MYA-4620 / CBS 123657 / FGSC 9075 / NRRL 31084 / PH-1) TaxID=229533 RepID=A0A0E0S8K9_GIBZE|nr:hypothetical protein FG05_35064 [Fusarium graminearum]CEF79834.1 unnamed protein product [Fusarium graminearum]
MSLVNKTLEVEKYVSLGYKMLSQETHLIVLQTHWPNVKSSNAQRDAESNVTSQKSNAKTYSS